MSVAKIQPSEEDWERIIENQRWLNELSAKEQRVEEQERLEAEEEERAYQQWRNSMGPPAYDPTSPAYMDSDAANRERERQAAIAVVRASFEHGLERTGYGPFKEDMIIAHAECNLMYPPHTKEWNLKFDKYDVVKNYRAWCWNKMHGSISKGW
jgi:hypothetical protein